ncbi:hypothetical protein MMC29_000123 [Sticta canariensis]|nr:hypothetical protein [Sticta canariensis]
MSEFKGACEAACESGLLPGVVLLASIKNDDFNYVKTMGVRTLDRQQYAQRIELDTALALASSIKLMTAIAALQCVER